MFDDIYFYPPEDEDSPWIQGVAFGEFYFKASVFDEGSDYGINGGRISKLMICYGETLNWNECFVNYDRGWDVEPETDEEIDMYAYVVECLEQLPEYDSRSVVWSA